MKKIETLAMSLRAVFIAGEMLALLVAWPSMSTAQDKSDKAKGSDPHAQHKEKQPAGGPDLGGQKQGMKMPGMSGQKQDSAWWYENYTRGQMPDMGGKGMAGGEGGMGGMKGMMNDKMDSGSAVGDSSSSGMRIMDDVDLMGMMADDTRLMGVVAIGGAGSESMKGMGEMKMASSLLGSPGVSHMYHVGATGFFLNHSEHIALSTRQQAALNVIKQKALLSKSTAQRNIAEAEQELWVLTSADDPDAAEIEAKIQQIEKLRGVQRMAFIQSVAQAAQLLTDEQRRMLLGTTEPVAAAGEVTREHGPH